MVQAQANQTKEVLELIPSKKLWGDLPPALVDGHIHWLNLITKIIEIRPLDRLWEYSAENWRIDCASGQYRMYRGPENLVGICSPTGAMLSECFKCFNNVDKSRQRKFLDDEYFEGMRRNLLITTSSVESVQFTSMQRLFVTLPSYGLSFFVNEMEELESRDFKDMVYDENQCVGTLFGLENILVLRPKTHIAGTLVPEAFLLRRVLIPDGFPVIHGDHQVRIDIDANSLARRDGPLYHAYDVDTELGCLIGNGSLMSTRYLAYLHTMTSYHRPDPLTGKTGAQAALCLLQSAGCRSIMKLRAFDDDEVWTSTQYPQINAAYKEIRRRYYWDRREYYDDHEVQEEHSARRAAYLFPANATSTGSTSLADYDEGNYLTTRRIHAEHGPTTNPRSDVSPFNQCLPRQIALDELLCNRRVPELPARSTLLRDSHWQTSSHDTALLDDLFFSLQADSSFQREYLAHLDTSAQCIRAESRRTYNVASGNLIEALKKYYMECRVNYLDSLEILRKSLGPTTKQASDQFCQWPPITADVLLRYLASASPINIPPCWKKCLISLALLLLDLHRARRLLRFALDGLEEEFTKELESEGCDGWNPEDYPDWLLIQVGFLRSSARPYSHYYLTLSDPRRLSHSSCSGSNCDGNHVPTIR